MFSEVLEVEWERLFETSKWKLLHTFFWDLLETAQVVISGYYAFTATMKIVLGI